MYLNEEFDYSIIDKHVKEEQIQKAVQESEIPINEDSIANKWFSFAYWYGIDHELNSLQSLSFAYVISYFLSTDIVESQTSKYYDEDGIIEKIKEYIANLKPKTKEKRKAHKIFFHIFRIYKIELANYEKKTQKIELNVSERIYNQFKTTPGDSIEDKFQFLMDCYFG